MFCVALGFPAQACIFGVGVGNGADDEDTGAEDADLRDVPHDAGEAGPNDAVSDLDAFDASVDVRTDALDTTAPADADATDDASTMEVDVAGDTTPSDAETGFDTASVDSTVSDGGDTSPSDATGDSSELDAAFDVDGGRSDADATVDAAADTVSDAAADTVGDAAADTCDSQKTWYVDQDNDGYGTTATTIQQCTQPVGFAPADGDCKPKDPEIHPKAVEYCDFINNDCDGQTDEGTCKPEGNICNKDWECTSRECDGGLCAQTILVTSTTMDGDFGVSQAKAMCNSLGLPGSWDAILSTDQKNARTRMNWQFPLYNRRGEKVADTLDDLYDRNNPVSLDHAVRYDEAAKANPADVWTGTKKNGDGEKTCKDNNSWATNDPGTDGTMGRSDQTDDRWTIKVQEHPCDNKAALYCIDGQ